MNIKILISLYIILNLLAQSFVFGQKNFEKIKYFSQEELNGCKLDSDVYSFKWSKHKYRWFPEGDTLPYFIDEREYKGLLNYGLEFVSKDRRSFSYMENVVIHKLNVSFSNFKFNPADSIVEIEGIISGGWTKRDFRESQNNIDIFIGNKKDTISIKYLENLFNSLEVDIKYKGEKIDSHIVLDSFPGFYMYNYQHYKTRYGNKRIFNIKTKVDRNSIITFGLEYCFSEIFEIGSLVYPEGNTRKTKTQKINRSLEPVVLIRNNIRESDRNNFEESVAIPVYYKITEKAENYIIRKQYGKAKQQYDVLLKEDKYIYARDMHNAVRSAIISRDYNTAIVWCEKLVLKGVGLKYFDAKVFNGIKNKTLWNEFLKKYPALHKEHIEGLNQTLKKELKALVTIDQTAYYKNSIGTIERSELVKVTESNDRKFIDLIEKEGFPTEEKIGVPLVEGGLSIGVSPVFFVLIIHSHQVNSEELKKIKSIINHSADVFEYDNIRDNLSVFKKGGNSCFHIYKGDLYNNKTCAIDQKQMRKIVFRFKNDFSFIIDQGKCIVIPFEHSTATQDELFFKERFNYIMKLTDDWFFYEK